MAVFIPSDLIKRILFVLSWKRKDRPTFFIGIPLPSQTM